MASATPNSLISEEYGSARRLDMNATSESPWERRSEASFSGVAGFRTLLGRQNNGSSSISRGGRGGSSMDVDREESYQGDFFIKRSISLAGPARYDHPHLRLRDELLDEAGVPGVHVSLWTSLWAPSTPSDRRGLAP